MNIRPFLLLTVLAFSALSHAFAADPCKLLTANEVASGLGAPAVTASPATDQDIPTCNYDFKDGSLSLGVTPGAAKMMNGKSLLQMLQSGGDSDSLISFKAAKVVPGVGDEAVGLGRSQTTSGLTQDFATLYVRKGDTVLVFIAASSGHAASRLTLQDVTLLARRAVLRLH